MRSKAPSRPAGDTRPKLVSFDHALNSIAARPQPRAPSDPFPEIWNLAGRVCRTTDAKSLCEAASRAASMRLAGFNPSVTPAGRIALVRPAGPTGSLCDVTTMPSEPIAPRAIPLSAVAGLRQRNRIDSVYAARELCEAALTAGGCADVAAAWSATIALAETRLADFLIALSLEAGGLVPQAAPVEIICQPPRHVRGKSGHAGIDHRPNKPLPYRARCWRNGKCIFDRSFSTLERAIDARARFKRDNP